MARAKLSGSLLARKDTPAHTITPVNSPAAPAKPTVGKGREDKPIALTLKIDQARYETLKALGARTRRSNQEMLLAALDAYLQGAR